MTTLQLTAACVSFTTAAPAAWLSRRRRCCRPLAGDGELTVQADLIVDGDLWLSGLQPNKPVQDLMDELLLRLQAVEHLAGNTTEHLLAVELLAERETLAKASSWFPNTTTKGVVFGEYARATAFGVDNCDVVIDYPVTAAKGLGRMVNGTFTAPVDGVYFITSEIRIADNDTAFVEVRTLVRVRACVRACLRACVRGVAVPVLASASH